MTRLLLAIQAGALTLGIALSELDPGALAIATAFVVAGSVAAAHTEFPPADAFDAALSALVALLAAATLWAVSVPGWHFFAAILCTWAWGAAAVFWTCWTGWLVVRRRRSGVRRAFALLSVPALGLAVAAAVALDIPLRARYAASIDEMNSIARGVSSGRLNPSSIERIGWFDVERAERLPGGMRFIVRGAGFLDRVGFAYSESDRPEARGEDYYDPYHGAWWVWTESW